MKVTPLQINGSWLIELSKFQDSRGFFFESFREDVAEKYFGRKFQVKQSNTSVSKKGSVRGIHYALVPPGQAKYVQCQKGSIIDYVIDIRIGSPTFSQFAEIKLSAENPQAIFIEEGLAHAFVALEDETVVTYFVSENYNPEREKGINPFDKDLKINWPDMNLIVSDKDQSAPTLKEAKQSNFLPLLQDCKNYLRYIPD
jgi:dTDP-4-dehydrorhamnose 3,5-epimerase